MSQDQLQVLSERLREIGFSDRAIGMIIEQVHELDLGPKSEPGLAEHAATFDSVSAQKNSMQQSDAPSGGSGALIGIVGGLITIVSIFLSWSALTTSGSAELAIMAGNSGPSLAQGIQAILLALWVILPPLLGSISRRSGFAITGQSPALTIWAAVSLLLATLLLVSAG